ncbi:MAG: hypothetical protein QOH81_2418 [Sphingomonadales bacterium]|jgi:hypothetical protein|nr:hypothetical protein [Sphingomonadales bacterium]
MMKAARLAVAGAAALMAAAPAAAQHGAFADPALSRGHGRHMPPGGPGFGGAPHFGAPFRGDRHRRFGAGFGGGIFWGLGYGGGLVDDPEYAGRDAGFFAGRAEARVANGGAYYDYDRAYPYDWYRDPDRAARTAPRVAAAAPMIRCDVAWVAARGGGRSPVRICRGLR